MGAFDWLLPNQLTQPLGYGPMAMTPPLPKAQTNVTGASIPAVKPPPYVTGPELLNSISNMNATNADVALKQQEANLNALNAQFAAAKLKALPQFMALLNGTGGQGASGGSPVSATPDGGNAPSGPSGVPSDTTVQSATAPLVSPSAITKEPKATALDQSEEWWKSIPGSANFAKNSGIFGDPNSPGWADNNLVTIHSPSGVPFKVNKLAAPSFQGFLGDLAAMGYDVKNGGGYNIRNIRGGHSLSEHAYGNAIDINPAANPMGTGPLKTDLPPNVSDLAAKWGLSWGGDWNSRKDAMHFEWAGVNPTTGVDYRGNVSGAPVQLSQNGPITSLPVTPAARAISASLSTPTAGAVPTAPVPGAPTRATGMDPMALARLGAMAQLYGFPDVATPLAQAYYKSPQYLQQAAGAAKAGELPYVGPTTSAEEWAKVAPQLYLKNNQPTVLRQGGAIFNPATGQVFAQNPRLPEGTSLAMGPNGEPIAKEVPGAIGAIQNASQAVEAGKANVEANPNAFNVQPPAGKGPGLDQPLPMQDGSVVPPVSQAAPIVGGAKSLDEQQKDWNERSQAWGEQQVPLQTAIQRSQMIGRALKDYQSGAYANELSELRAGLKAAGINLPDSIAGDPAQAQIILKNAFRATLDTLQAAHLSRATQMEVKLSLDNFANPNLQPAANLAILGQTLGQLQWEQAKIQGWAEAKKNGWRDPNDYERAWIQQPQNNIQGFIDRAEGDIGPLKGAPQPQAQIPTGAHQIGTYQGNPVYQMPDGSRKVLQ